VIFLEFWSFLILFFSVGLLLYSFFSLKKGDFTINEYLFWSFFSLMLVFFSFNFKFLEKVAFYFQFYRLLDFVTVFGFMFFVVVIIFLYKQNKRLERKVNSLVMNLALENFKDDRKKDDGKKK